MKKATYTGGYPGKVRIIAGEWRGRTLEVAETEGLRPTPNRVRETVFNWLQSYITGAHCIDLFAGTGALCFEALSRGAASATLVEKAPQNITALQKSKDTLLAKHAHIVQHDAIDYLKGATKPFDIIFLDPPFASNYINTCSALIHERQWLAPQGLIYIEAPSTLHTLPTPKDWQILKQKNTGQVSYYLLQHST